MPVRNDHVPWTIAEQRRVAVLSSQGFGSQQVAAAINKEFHGGESVRTREAVRLLRSKNGVYVAKVKRDRVKVAAPQTEQEVEHKATEGGIEARANGKRIKTVEDLLAHIEADMSRYEIEKSEATKYEVATKDELTGKVETTELHRVFVRLRGKAGPSALEAVESIIKTAFSKRTPIAKASHAKAGDVMQAIVIADPHIGKYAWSHETGWEDYDISIATQLLRASAAELIADGDSRGVGRRVILLLGDYFHYDTPGGATTKGTPLDRDGRVEKMIAAGASALFDIIEASAKRVNTEVVLVPGNHDAVLTVALRQILTAHFRRDSRVTVDARGTSRKYLEHGRCLIGMTHGDKARKRLGELMAAEASEAWGRSRYREIHTGHLHSVAEVQTIGGVVVRTAPALCPPDGWHALEGYVGAPRGMESYYYHPAGNLVGMTMASPRGA